MDLVNKQREERKRRILEVARVLIAERGFDGVTMRDLADQSLVSVPTLYNLFGGKSQLLSAAVQSNFARMIGSADSHGDLQGLDKLISLTRMFSPHLLAQPEFARSIMGFFVVAADSTVLRDFVARELTQQLVVALEQMKRKRQLVAWVDTWVLGERIATQMLMTSLEWAHRRLSDESVGSAILFGTAALLLGFTRGKAVAELETLIKREQTSAAARDLSDQDSPGTEDAAAAPMEEG
jgi:AcrR family transcriptional regulator